MSHVTRPGLKSWSPDPAASYQQDQEHGKLCSQTHPARTRRGAPGGTSSKVYSARHTENMTGPAVWSPMCIPHSQMQKRTRRWACGSDARVTHCCIIDLLVFFFSREFNQQNFANIFILSLKNSQRHISFPLATCPSLLVKKIRMVALG